MKAKVEFNADVVGRSASDATWSHQECANDHSRLKPLPQNGGKL